MEHLSTIKNKILTLATSQNSILKSNPSFESKINEMLSSFPNEEEVTVQNINEKEGKITIELTYKNGGKYRITCNFANVDEISVIHDFGYDSPSKRTIMEQKIVAMPGMGFEYHQNTVDIDTENCKQYTHNEYAQSLRERYDKSGIMTKMKRTVFGKNVIEFAINEKELTTGNHLFTPRNYGNFGYAFNSNIAVHDLELSRISHDVVKVNSQGRNNAYEDITYEGYQLLGDNNYIMLPRYPHFLLTSYDLLPGVSCAINRKSANEIETELYRANLSSEQREFLFQLAQKNERNEFSVDPSKSTGVKR